MDKKRKRGRKGEGFEPNDGSDSDGPKRIDDLTPDDLNLGGGGDEGDLGFFKEACRHYQQATRSTDQEAIEHIYGDGDWDDRAAAWVGEPAPGLLLELHLSARVPDAAALRASADAQHRAVRGAPLPEEADLARALAHALIWSATPPLPGDYGVVTMGVRAQEHRRGQASAAARRRARRRSTSGGATGLRCPPPGRRRRGDLFGAGASGAAGGSGGGWRRGAGREVGGAAPASDMAVWPTSMLGNGPSREGRGRWSTAARVCGEKHHSTGTRTPALGRPGGPQGPSCPPGCSPNNHSGEQRAAGSARRWSRRVWMMGSRRQTAGLSGDGCRCVGLRCPWSREPCRTAFRTEASAFTFRQSAGAQVEHRPCVTTRCGLSTLFS